MKYLNTQILQIIELESKIFSRITLAELQIQFPAEVLHNTSN